MFGPKKRGATPGVLRGLKKRKATGLEVDHYGTNGWIMVSHRVGGAILGTMEDV